VQVTASGEIKVLDFGIARAEFNTREAQSRSALLGSVRYMAPERFEGAEGPAGDVYSLGCVLQELLTGKRIGKSLSRRALHDVNIACAQRRLSDLRRGLPELEQLQALVVQMLSFEPERRPSAREVERRCLELSRQGAGVGLRDWAEWVVPQLQGSSSSVQIDQGQVTSEQSCETWSEELSALYDLDTDDTLEFEELLRGSSPQPAGSVLQSALQSLIIVASVLLMTSSALGWLMWQSTSDSVTGAASPSAASVVTPAMEHGDLVQPLDILGPSRPTPGVYWGAPLSQTALRSTEPPRFDPVAP